MSPVNLPPDSICLAMLALVLASTLGFVAGHQTVRWQDRRAERRARSGPRRLYETVLRTLDGAAEVCQLLDRIEGRSLTSSQTEHLEKRQNILVALVSRILNRQRGMSERPAAPAVANRPPDPFKVSWTQQPSSPVTGLPDRTAFETNLEALLEAGRKANRSSHLLLIRVDRLPSLVSRCGQAGVNSLLRRLSSVLCRAIRDTDLICQIGPDQFAVLMPGTDPGSGQRLSAGVRDAVRSHRFHIDETGPEILLTASFGLSPCLAEDRPELVLDRAAHALSKSQKLGRNQLHVHDGIDVVHCAVSAA